MTESIIHFPYIRFPHSEPGAKNMDWQVDLNLVRLSDPISSIKGYSIFGEAFLNHINSPDNPDS
jgi:hypothetical protein